MHLTILQPLQDGHNQQMKIHLQSASRVRNEDSKGVTYIDKDENEQFVPADLIVLSGGVAATPEESAKFYGSGKRVHYIGDCYRPGDVHKAVTAGFATGNQI